eukprot:2798643-Alexandrium_andersonii.AAC.1
MSDKLGEIVESYDRLQKKEEELDKREAALEQKVEQLAKATAINHQTSATPPPPPLPPPVVPARYGASLFKGATR